MRIAVLAPVAWRTPPRHYGPWEQMASNLTEGLVKAGIEVTLFATADSITTAKLDAVINEGYEEDKTLDAKVAECLHISTLGSLTHVRRLELKKMAEDWARLAKAQEI